MVQNRIVKVQKRNRALVKFDADKICRAILKAAQSIGGFDQDCLPGINEKIFDAWNTDEALADFLADAVVVGSIADEHHLISNFPPDDRRRSRTGAARLAQLRFSKHGGCLRVLSLGTALAAGRRDQPKKFVGNGFPERGHEQSAGVESHARRRHRRRPERSGRRGEDQRRSSRSRSADYEKSLDEAAAKVMARMNAGDKIRMMWVSGPSSSGKTTTTVKLTERLEKQGLRFLMLNLDDYFWSLVEHPTDWINDRNYETPEALDIQLLNQHLMALARRQNDRETDLQFQRRPPHRHQTGEAGEGPDPVARLFARPLSADHGRHRCSRAVQALHRNAERACMKAMAARSG